MVLRPGGSSNYKYYSRGRNPFYSSIYNSWGQNKDIYYQFPALFNIGIMHGN